MSDMYLTLLRRIECVTTWVRLGTDVMKAARNDQGASYETIARAVPTSSKTYERWEKRGEVPNYAIEAVAAALNLRIERAERRSLTLPDEGAPDAPPGEADERLDRVEQRLEEVRGLVLELLGRPSEPQSAQPARRRTG
jgi:DNA-binding XRE family transcriptional regulator